MLGVFTFVLRNSRSLHLVVKSISTTWLLGNVNVFRNGVGLIIALVAEKPTSKHLRSNQYCPSIDAGSTTAWAIQPATISIYDILTCATKYYYLISSHYPITSTRPKTRGFHWWGGCDPGPKTPRCGGDKNDQETWSTTGVRIGRGLGSDGLWSQVNSSKGWRQLARIRITNA